MSGGLDKFSKLISGGTKIRLLRVTELPNKSRLRNLVITGFIRSRKVRGKCPFHLCQGKQGMSGKAREACNGQEKIALL